MLQQHPPQREPPLADVGTSLDVVAQALAPGTGPGLARGACLFYREGIVCGRDRECQETSNRSKIDRTE